MTPLVRHCFCLVANNLVEPASSRLTTFATGLTTDDQSLRDQRTELWTDFNHAWLAIFQRQKDMMLAGQRSSNLIAPSKLEKMGKDLIKWCDNIERHGLVDYQYGVEEERILDSKWHIPCPH
jgi:hypothetical protein